MVTSRSGSATPAGGVSSVALTKAKIAEVAPIPSASVITATPLVSGALRSTRHAYRTSCRNTVMAVPVVQRLRQ